MKNRISILLMLTLLCFAFAKAQRGIRVGYVDMNYILESVPEYQKASDQLEQRMQSWKVEIEKMESEIGQMESSLKNERVLLTKELVEEREEEISIKREQLSTYQQKRFGAEGDFIKQKQQLIQPVQDQVFNEMQKIGQQKKYDIILERSEVTMLYSDDRHDLSDDVLRAIGRTGKANDRAEARGLGKTAPVKEMVLDEPYMSVQEAADDAAVDRIKQEAADSRQAIRAEKIRVRDSIKEARARAYKERRDQMIKERARKKDSVLQARKDAREGNKNNPPGGN
ncbi:OmpH family outer membrane protein [Nonlabens antarcticus]|uniref:OmpH family outer membrane protein n=1 Tax=Nonlabens antarcticus TaxID=392714 RepID=UPI001890FCC1|nr:OmpH family outer membrane protein [Nonlabens antarcticus]